MYYNLFISDMLGIDRKKQSVIAGVGIVTKRAMSKSDVSNILSSSFVKVVKSMNASFEGNFEMKYFNVLDESLKCNFCAKLFVDIKESNTNIVDRIFFFRFDRDDFLCDDYLTDLPSANAILGAETYLKVLVQGLVKLWQRRRIIDGETPYFHLYYDKKDHSDQYYEESYGQTIGRIEIDTYVKKILEISGSLLDEEDCRSFQKVLQISYIKDKVNGKHQMPFDMDIYELCRSLENLADELRTSRGDINAFVDKNIDEQQVVTFHSKNKIDIVRKLEKFGKLYAKLINRLSKFGIEPKYGFEEFNEDKKTIIKNLDNLRIDDNKYSHYAAVAHKTMGEISSKIARLTFDNLDSTETTRFMRYPACLAKIALDIVVNMDKYLASATDDIFKIEIIKTYKRSIDDTDLLYQDLKRRNLGEFYVKAVFKPTIKVPGKNISMDTYKTAYENWITEIDAELEYASNIFATSSLNQQSKISDAIDNCLQYAVRNKALDIRNQVSIETMINVIEKLRCKAPRIANSKIVDELLLNLDLYLLKITLNKNDSEAAYNLKIKIEDKLTSLNENQQIDLLVYQKYYGLLQSDILLNLLDRFDFSTCATKAKKLLNNKYLTNVQLGKIANIYILAKSAKLKQYVLNEENQTMAKSCCIDLMDMAYHALRRFEVAREGEEKRTYSNLADIGATLNLTGLSLVLLWKSIIIENGMTDEAEDICIEFREVINDIHCASEYYKDKKDKPDINRINTLRNRLGKENFALLTWMKDICNELVSEKSGRNQNLRNELKKLVKDKGYSVNIMGDDNTLETIMIDPLKINILRDNYISSLSPSNYYDAAVYDMLVETYNLNVLANPKLEQIISEIIYIGKLNQMPKPISAIFNEIILFRIAKNAPGLFTKIAKSNIIPLQKSMNVYPDCVYYWRLAEAQKLNNSNKDTEKLYLKALSCFECDNDLKMSDDPRKGIKNAPALLSIKIGILASYIIFLVKNNKDIRDVYNQFYEHWALFKNITNEKHNGAIAKDYYSGASFRAKFEAVLPKTSNDELVKKLAKVSSMVPY